MICWFDTSGDIVANGSDNVNELFQDFLSRRQWNLGEMIKSNTHVICFVMIKIKRRRTISINLEKLISK
jgi:hypothetical protein